MVGRRNDIPKPGLRAIVARTPEERYKVFFETLEANPDAGKVLKVLLPKCDARAVANLAALYAQNPHCLIRSRKERVTKFKRVMMPILREKGRRLLRKRSPNPDEIRELEWFKGVQRRLSQAFSTKRLGVCHNNLILFVLREYLHFKSGTPPSPTELVAIIEAAHAAFGWEEERDFVDSDLIRRNLRNFEKNLANSALCQLVRGQCAIPLVEAHRY